MMRGGYMEAIGCAVFRNDLPEPQIEHENDVKIRVRVCGICGSEVHALHGLHPFRIPPVLSGHEYAGDVVEVGSGVKNIKVGDELPVTLDTDETSILTGTVTEISALGNTIQNAAYLSAWKGSVPVQLPFDEAEYDALLAQRQEDSKYEAGTGKSKQNKDYVERWQIVW